MLGLKTSLIALGVGVILGALPAGYFAHKYTDNKWVAATERLKNEAAETLQKATGAVIAAERENAKLANKMDVDHAKAEKQIRATLAENRRLVYSLGGMRDPGCGEGGSGGVSGSAATPGGAANCATGNRLSDETAEFLLGFAEEADTAANYARTCHDWVLSVRENGGD